MHFSFSKNKYLLELRWKKIKYLNDRTAVPIEPVLTGPVLKEVGPMADNDFIKLDFTKQLSLLYSDIYIVHFSWRQTFRYPDGINLKGAVFTNNHLKELFELDTAGYILIDTYNHREKVHPLNLVYEARIVKGDGEPVT